MNIKIKSLEIQMIATPQRNIEKEESDHRHSIENNIDTFSKLQILDTKI